MTTRSQNNADLGEPGKEKGTAAKPEATGSGDTCRCKEVAVMKPRKLFGLMISDLAFWRKTKKE